MRDPQTECETLKVTAGKPLDRLPRHAQSNCQDTLITTVKMQSSQALTWWHFGGVTHTSEVGMKFGVLASRLGKAAVESTLFGLAYHSDTLDRDWCIQRGKGRGKSREEPTQLPEKTPPQPSPFPVSSPLLASHALSPHLFPASWDSEECSLSPLSPLRLASDALCNYCDEEFPLAPSAMLIAMGEKLFNISWADPLPETPHHRSLPGITMAVDHCARHQYERDLIPAAILHNWPFTPDFSSLWWNLVKSSQLV
ncbi:hypothetical protein B0H14DRAFT_2574555 [Mycena olivaceomarginata]|nr:hypothetical protein B0H14DRAFT_2574555 [Mycena olivaceomarginata]